MTQLIIIVKLKLRDLIQYCLQPHVVVFLPQKTHYISSSHSFFKDILNSAFYVNNVQYPFAEDQQL